MPPAHAAPEQRGHCQQRSCIGSSQGYYAEFSRPGVLSCCSVRAPTRPALVAMSVRPAPSAGGNVLRAVASRPLINTRNIASPQQSCIASSSAVAPARGERRAAVPAVPPPSLRRHPAAAGLRCRLRRRVRRRLTAEGWRYFTHQISPAYHSMFPAALMQPLLSLQLFLPCVEQARLPRTQCVP